MRRPTLRDMCFIGALVVIATLLVVNLGAYALWDDEANTAIFAANLWRFHDLLAFDGTNIVAFRDGLELTGIKNRVFPPFQYVWAAPWVGLFGRTAFVARFPFVLAAFGGFVLWAHWLRKTQAKWHVLLVTFMAIVGNVSLFLYSRQSRYYGLTWALSVGIAYVYVYRAESRRTKALLVLLPMVLMATNYLTYGATMVCLGVDYLLFEIWQKKDSWSQRFGFLASQIAFVAGLTYVFNPLGRKVTPYVPASFWADKLTLWWWNIRELNGAEFFWPPLIALSLIVFFIGRRRDLWLLRALIALPLYAFVAAVLSQQPVGWARLSDIRYMAAVIPLCIFIAVRTLTSLDFKVTRAAGIALAFVLFFSTVPHVWFNRVDGGVDPIEYRSTFVTWLKELKSPPRQSYREAAQWLNEHAKPGQTVAVQPQFAMYPLMFHAPQLVYMWQFNSDRRADYPMLPEPHFRFLTAPDYFVSFGPEVGFARNQAVPGLAQQGVTYDPEVRLEVAGTDKSRPELFWRVFKEQSMNDPNWEATFITPRTGASGH